MNLNPDILATWNFVLKNKIPSVNNIYVPRFGRAKGGKGKFLGMALAPEVRAYRDEITEQLKTIYKLKPGCIKVGPENYIDISFVFIFKENVFKRDIDNTIKETTDAIAKYLEFNDAYVITVVSKKRYNPKAEFESVLVKVSRSMEENMYDLDINHSVG